MPPPKRHILIPVGGDSSFATLIDYLNRMRPGKDRLEATLLHVSNLLPAEFVEDAGIDTAGRRQIAAWQEAATEDARSLLTRARSSLLEAGVGPLNIHTVQVGREVGTVRDICRWAAGHPVDAVLVARRGRAGLDAYFMSGITGRLADNCTRRALWIVNGEVPSDRVLVFYDCEANGLRAAEPAAHMLHGTSAGITLFHIRRSLRHFTSREFREQLPELESIWSANSSRYIEPKLASARRMLLSSGFPESRVDTRIVESSGNTADDIIRQVRQDGCGTVVLCRCGVPSVREFLQGIAPAAGRDPISGLAVWIV